MIFYKKINFFDYSEKLQSRKSNLYAINTHLDRCGQLTCLIDSTCSESTHQIAFHWNNCLCSVV